MSNKKEQQKAVEMIPPQMLVLVDSEKRRPMLLALRKSISRFNEFWDRYGMYFVIAGLILNTFFLVYATNIITLICEILYIPGFIYNIYVIITNKRGIGMVKDAGTDQPLDLAMVRVQKDNKTLQMRVTSRTGQFFIMLPPGLYEISATRIGYVSKTKSLIITPGKQAKAVSTTISLEKEIRKHPLPL